MVYQVNFTRSAFRSLERIPEPFYTAIKRSIIRLADNPRPSGYKKLKGVAGYRIRINDYRVIYDILDDILTIEIIAIAPRKEIYR